MTNISASAPTSVFLRAMMRSLSGSRTKVIPSAPNPYTQYGTYQGSMKTA